MSEVTLRAVRIEPLAENTTVQTLKQVKANHAKMLRQNRHIRYMWIPFTDSVVVVTVNPLSACPRGVKATDMAPDAQRLQPLVALLRQARWTGARPPSDSMNACWLEALRSIHDVSVCIRLEHTSGPPRCFRGCNPRNELRRPQARTMTHFAEHC